MKLTIHRSTKEIGGSCVEISTGTTRLVLDLCLPLVDINREPFDSIGHADAMVRFIDERTVFRNDYSRVDPGFGSKVGKVLTRHGLTIEIMPYFRWNTKGFVYADLIYLLDAYMKASDLQISMVPNEHGTIVEFETFGHYDPNPPDPPWQDRETV